jgi:hypothetical protein
MTFPQKPPTKTNSMKSIYTVRQINIHDGSRTEVAAPFSSRREAIKTAEEHKAGGAYCEVMETAVGVAPHAVVIHQTATGK